MAFYVQKAVSDLKSVIDPAQIVERLPHHNATFDAMARDKAAAFDSRVPAKWGPIMQGAGEWKRVARFPQTVWTMLMRMHDEGLAPDPLKDDRYFYGLLFEHPAYQAYPMKREGGK